MCFHNPWFYLLVLVVNCEKWKHLVKTLRCTTLPSPSLLESDTPVSVYGHPSLHTCWFHICCRATARSSFVGAGGYRRRRPLLSYIVGGLFSCHPQYDHTRNMIEFGSTTPFPLKSGPTPLANMDTKLLLNCALFLVNIVVQHPLNRLQYRRFQELTHRGVAKYLGANDLVWFLST